MVMTLRSVVFASTIIAARCDVIPDTMLAAVLSRSVDLKAHPENIKIEEVPVPKLGPGMVLVKVLGASMNPSDVDLMMSPIGPRKLGVDFSGVVVKTGLGCQKLQAGDEVYASSGLSGALAEYVVASCFTVAKKPATLNFTEAGVLAEVGLTGLQSFRWAGGPDLKLLNNATVVVLGGSGGTGHIGIQIAKACGAGKVIATCGPEHIDFVKSIGADQVVNYHEENWYDVLPDGSVDIVYDTVAKRGTGGHAIPKFAEGGRYVTLLPFSLAGPAAMSKRPDVKQHEVSCTDCIRRDRLEELAKLVDAGLVKPHVEHVYALSDVQSAFRHLMAGHTTGKVAVVPDAHGWDNHNLHGDDALVV